MTMHTASQEESAGGSVIQRSLSYVVSQSPPWLVSTAAHTFLFVIIALIPHQIASQLDRHSVAFEAVKTEQVEDAPQARFELGETPLDPSTLSTETLTDLEARPIAQTAQYNDDSPIFEERGGGTLQGVENGAGLGFEVSAAGLGPMINGNGGVDVGEGFGNQAGSGGDGSGFGLRGSGNREAIPGVTKASERAVAAALNWISRHQNRDGSWSIRDGDRRPCPDASCTGVGVATAESAATALAILPFLGAGQTHQSKGPYQKHIQRGIHWLLEHQAPDGDLSDGQHQMYSHGLATLALCEAYGMTQDSKVGHAAQKAINFIQSAQNGNGGWRYRSQSYEGDTSVFGWQVMALKSGQMAHLDVNSQKFQRCKMWLQQVSSGYHQGIYAYLPGQGPRPSMTAVGLLAAEYLGASRQDRSTRESMEYLMANMPSKSDRDIYYWYYATLSLHNIPGAEWEKWNRQIRRILIETQIEHGCATGSWNPSDDAWGSQGGRLMVTSLSALTLEVYYRYLPLYQMDSPPPAEAEQTRPTGGF